MKKCGKKGCGRQKKLRFFFVVSEKSTTFAGKTTISTMTHVSLNTATQQEVTTLDVLWAFYLSQPRRVKRAFLSRIEAEEHPVAEFQWFKDLKAIRALKENWDDEGAKPINRTAIREVQKMMNMLSSQTATKIRLFPTPMGAVMVKLETSNGRIKGEIGNKQMSYFVKREGTATEHHSFEDLNKGNIALLVQNLEAIG